MRIYIQPRLNERFPGLQALVCRVKGVKIERESSELELFKKEVVDEIKRDYDIATVKDAPIFRAYRDFFWRIGIDPTKNRPAVEALIRRVLAEKPLPTINTLVDAYNLASIKTCISIGAFDAGGIRGDLALRLARRGEEFTGIGMEKPMVLEGNEAVVSDSEKLIAIYPYRDADDTKVTLSTRDVLLLICGAPGIDEEKLKCAAKTTVDYITRFCGGGEIDLMRGIKVVLFDLDETLIDAPAGLDAAHRAVTRRLRDYLRESGIDADETTIRLKLDDFDDRMNMETKYDRDEWWPVLLSELGFKGKVPRRITEELTGLYWDTYSRASKPYPDAEPTLNYLKQKGYKLGLVTDTDGKPGIKDKRLKHLDFIRMFDVVVVSGEDTAQTKPSPEPFLLAASKLGLNAEECAVVGDKPFTDIKGAKAAGMRAIRVKRRDWGTGEPADLVVDSLAELLKIF